MFTSVRLSICHSGFQRTVMSKNRRKTCGGLAAWESSAALLRRHWAPDLVFLIQCLQWDLGMFLKSAPGDLENYYIWTFNMHKYLRSTLFWFMNNSYHTTHFKTKPQHVLGIFRVSIIKQYILPVFCIASQTWTLPPWGLGEQ